MRSGTQGFISRRLKMAREARGVTITALAESTGVTKQSISAYENDRQIPGPLIVSRLAKELRLPTQFFLKPLPQIITQDVFFRTYSAATKRVRIQAKRKLEWVSEIVDYLNKFLELVPVRVPDYDVGRNVERVNFNEIDEIALECRREFGLSNGPISHMIRLLENNGAIVVLFNFAQREMDAFSTWIRNDIPLVVLSSDKNCSVRTRFDAAHELGHLVLHRSIKANPENQKSLERQAHRFASSFLMPAETFLQEVRIPNLNTFLILKERWKVSVAAMIKRCQDLNLLSEIQAKNLWTYRNHRWGAKWEPLDDIIPVEQPTFLQRCIELLVTEKIRGREDILMDLLLSAEDIENLASLSTGYFHQNAQNIYALPTLRSTQVDQPDQQKSSIIPFSKKRNRNRR